MSKNYIFAVGEKVIIKETIKMEYTKAKTEYHEGIIAKIDTEYYYVVFEENYFEEEIKIDKNTYETEEGSSLYNIYYLEENKKDVETEKKTSEHLNNKSITLKSEFHLLKIKEYEEKVKDLEKRVAQGEKKKALLKITKNSLEREKALYNYCLEEENKEKVTEVNKKENIKKSSTTVRKNNNRDTKYTEKEMSQHLTNNEEMYYTNKLNATYYVTRGGKQISFGYDCGCRTNDHRTIFSCFDDIEYNDFNTLMKSTGLLMCIPETGDCWCLKGQRLSKEQKNFIESYGLNLIRE